MPIDPTSETATPSSRATRTLCTWFTLPSPCLSLADPTQGIRPPAVLTNPLSVSRKSSLGLTSKVGASSGSGVSLTFLSPMIPSESSSTNRIFAVERTLGVSSTNSLSPLRDNRLLIGRPTSLEDPHSNRAEPHFRFIGRLPSRTIWEPAGNTNSVSSILDPNRSPKSTVSVIEANSINAFSRASPSTIGSMVFLR